MATAAVDPPAEEPGFAALRALELEAAAALDTGITFGDRRFRRSPATTIEQDAYTSRALQASGLRGILRKFDPLRDDIDGAVSETLLAAFTNGHAFSFLAGGLVEDGVPWDVPSAERNARFFATRADPADKAQIYDLIQWVLLDFFLHADASWRVFLSYLLRSRSEEQRSDATANASSTERVVGDQNPQTNSRELEDRSTAASGTTSSGPSPAMTSTGSD